MTANTTPREMIQTKQELVTWLYNHGIRTSCITAMDWVDDHFEVALQNKSTLDLRNEVPYLPFNFTKAKTLEIIEAKALLTLEGFPQECYNFSIENAIEITDLRGGPVVVDKEYQVNYSHKLVSLKGIPDRCERLVIHQCPSLKKIDYLPTQPLKELYIKLIPTSANITAPVKHIKVSLYKPLSATTFRTLVHNRAKFVVFSDIPTPPEMQMLKALNDYSTDGDYVQFLSKLPDKYVHYLHAAPAPSNTTIDTLLTL